MERLEEISEDEEKSKIYSPNGPKATVSKDGASASSPTMPDGQASGWAGWMASSAVNLTMAAAR